MRRYIGGVLFFFGLAALGSFVNTPVGEGSGFALAVILFVLVIPGAIWLFRKPKA